MQSKVTPGVTTAGVLADTLGQPEESWSPTIRPQAKILEYRDRCTYQVEHNIVVGVSCPPSAPEATLQYWRHQWIGHEQSFGELAGSLNIHGQKRFQFASKQAATTVIYDEATDSVLRVVKYEKH